MGCSMPGLLVHHQLPEFTQTHVHWVSDAIQPSHPLSSPSPPALNLFQHKGLFKWVSSSHHSWAYLVAQLVKNPPAMWETWVQSLGWEDPLEKTMATNSSILAWRIPRTVCRVHGVAKSWTWLSDFHFLSLHLTGRFQVKENSQIY